MNKQCWSDNVVFLWIGLFRFCVCCDMFVLSVGRGYWLGKRNSAQLSTRGEKQFRTLQWINFTYKLNLLNLIFVVSVSAVIVNFGSFKAPIGCNRLEKKKSAEGNNDLEYNDILAQAFSLFIKLVLTVWTLQNYWQLGCDWHKITKDKLKTENFADFANF